MSSSSNASGNSAPLPEPDKKLIKKMLSDAAVPPPIIDEVLTNTELSHKLLTIIRQAQSSGKPAGAETWAKVEAALAEAGIKRKRVDTGMFEMGEGGKLRPAASQTGPKPNLKEGEEELIREYLGTAPENLIQEVLGNKEMAEGVLGVARKSQEGKK